MFRRKRDKRREIEFIVYWDDHTLPSKTDRRLIMPLLEAILGDENGENHARVHCGRLELYLGFPITIEALERQNLPAGLIEVLRPVVKVVKTVKTMVEAADEQEAD